MEVALGKGPAIKVRDSGMLADPRVVRWMSHTAEQDGIAYQLEVLEGGHNRRARDAVDPFRRSGRLPVHSDALHPQPVGNGRLPGCAPVCAAVVSVDQPPRKPGMKPSAVQGYLAGCWRQVTARPGFRGQRVLAVFLLGLVVGCSSFPDIRLPFLTPAPTSTSTVVDLTATPAATLPVIPTDTAVTAG